MTVSQLVQILNEYGRTYGDRFVVAADEYSILGDVNSVMLTDDGDIAITFIPD